MNAVHWIRSRQEERELAYWLSFVAYDQRDRSVSNRIYLLYLVIFFSIWIFVVLAYFAGGAAQFLRMVNPADPAGVALAAEALLLGGWTLFSLVQSFRRSPVVFNEADAVLICQTPVSRRQVTLRWLPMPWLKAALPFGLVAVGLGFALAELALAGNLSAGRIPEYSLFGLRALSALLPVHLALFLLPWLAGVLRLQRDADRDRWRVPVTALAAGVLALALLPLLNPNGPLWPGVAQVMAFPLRAGFGAGSLGLGVLAGGIAAALLLAALAAVSGGFSLTRAAQETQDLENLQAAQRYGFSSLAEDLQTRRRLGVRRAASRLPARAGAGALVWKDLLQAGRAFRLTDLIGWVSLFGAMLTLPLLPDLGSRALVIAVWAQQVGKLVTRRLRSDLSRWVLFRQLPFSGQTVLRYDLLPALAAAGVLSLLGLGLGLALTGSPPEPLLALLPGTVTAAGYAAAYDVLRRSRSSLLLNGSAPEVSALGVIGGVLAVAVPVGISALLQPPALGLFWAVPVSLLLAWLTYRLAARSYTKIDAG